MAFDLQNLSQPGAGVPPMSVPNPAPVPSEAINPAIAPPAASNPPSVNLGQPPAPPAGGTPVGTPDAPKHARLLAMVSGLAAGLSGLGTAISTRGERGGAPQVQAQQEAAQQQRIQEQQAQTAQKNAQLQQQLTTGEINRTNGQNYLLMATLPDEIAGSHLGLQEKQAEVTGKQQSNQMTLAEFQQSHGGLSPEQYSQALSSDQPATGAANGPAGSFFKTTAQQQLQAATPILGDTDPYVQNLKAVLANPNSTPKDLAIATTHLETQQAREAQATEQLTKKETALENAPFTQAKADAVNAVMLRRYQASYPLAKTLPDEYKLKAGDTKVDLEQMDRVLQQTATEHQTATNQDFNQGMREQMFQASGLSAPAGDLTKTGPDYLKSLPASTQSLVQSIGEGHIVLSRADYLAARNQKLLEEITRAYPDFDQAKAAAYPELQKDFTSGKVAAAINSGGATLNHLATLKALNEKQGSAIPGTNAYQDYKTAADRVAKEVGNFYQANNIPGVESVYKDLMALRPSNRDAAIQTTARLMGSKFDAFAQQWKEGAPSSAFESKMPDISPEAKAARAQLDPEYAARTQQAGNISVTAPDGSVHTFTNQASADNFKKLARIQ